MYVPTNGNAQEPLWGTKDRKAFNSLLNAAVNPFPQFVDRDTELSYIEIHNERLNLIADALDKLGKSQADEQPVPLAYLTFVAQANKMKDVASKLENNFLSSDDDLREELHRFGIEARRIVQSATGLSQDRINQLAEVAVTCSRYVATVDFHNLQRTTEQIFLEPELITSQRDRQIQIIESYKNWSKSSDRLMTNYASAREFAKADPVRLQNIDDVLSNLEKLRVFQREVTAEFLEVHFPDGELNASIYLILSDMDKVNSRPDQNLGATMDLKAFRKNWDDDERNCTRTSVSTVHRLGGANVRAGAIASDGSSGSTMTHAVFKFADIYDHNPIQGWKGKDGQTQLFKSVQDLFFMLEKENKLGNMETALVQWSYAGLKIGHVTVATMIKGQPAIVESQDRSVIIQDKDGTLVRHTISADDPYSLSSEPIEMEPLSKILLVPVPSEPSIDGKPCSHRKKCEQASEIMGQVWENGVKPNLGLTQSNASPVIVSPRTQR